MIYYDVKPLGELIQEFYEQHRGPQYIDEIKAVESWPKVVGPFIALHTMDISVKNKVLFVRVDSDALRNELYFSKSLLIRNLNDLIKKHFIEDIVLN